MAHSYLVWGFWEEGVGWGGCLWWCGYLVVVEEDVSNHNVMVRGFPNLGSPETHYSAMHEGTVEKVDELLGPNMFR